MTEQLVETHSPVVGCGVQFSGQEDGAAPAVGEGVGVPVEPGGPQLLGG